MTAAAATPTSDARLMPNLLVPAARPGGRTTIDAPASRRPAGASRLAAPPVPQSVPRARGVVLIAVGLSMLFPMLGLTLLTVLAVDLAFLTAIPGLKRAVS